MTFNNFLTYISSFNVTEISSILIVLITAIYTIGTFLLFFLQKRALDLTHKQIDLMLYQSKSTSYNNIINSHREIISIIMSDEKILNKISHNFGYSNTDIFINKFIATLFINHTLSIYINYKNNLLTKKQWDFVIVDILDLFSLDFIKKRWLCICNYYPKDFVNMINSILNIWK